MVKAMVPRSRRTTAPALSVPEDRWQSKLVSDTPSDSASASAADPPSLWKPKQRRIERLKQRPKKIRTPRNFFGRNSGKKRVSSKSFGSSVSCQVVPEWKPSSFLRRKSRDVVESESKSQKNKRRRSSDKPKQEIRKAGTELKVRLVRDLTSYSTCPTY
jgi:hypothetical protein